MCGGSATGHVFGQVGYTQSCDGNTHFLTAPVSGLEKCGVTIGIDGYAINNKCRGIVEAMR